MRPSVLLLAVLSSYSSAQTAPPTVGPVGGHDAPWKPKLPDPYPEFGFWPIDQLYGVAVDLAGRKRIDEWVAKGLKSIEKNLYRKHYIEGGYFLIPLPAPDAPRDENEHLFYVPDDPGSDPRVIFMKEIHKLVENTNGTHEGILQALLSGDKDLVNLAGRSLFDSKFTVKDWDHTLAEKHFQDKKGDDRVYYYKYRQSGLTRIKVEAGLGKALQLGDAPYFVGGSLGVEANARYRRSGFGKDAVPRAKLGVWGKMPWVEGASFGLSAIQGWHADNGLFENELRLGGYWGRGQSTLGVVAYRRVAGQDPLSPDTRVLGGQLHYAPSDAIGFFFTGESVRNRGADDETRFLAGVELLARGKADPSAWADQVLGVKRDGRLLVVDAAAELERGQLFALAQHAAAAARGIGPRPADADALLDALRRRELENAEEFRLLLPGGIAMRAPALSILEASCSIEARRFRESRGQSEVPGWPGPHCRPLSPAEAVDELLRASLPSDALAQVRRHAPSFFDEQMGRVILIHASAVRRAVDRRVLQGAGLAAIALQKGHDDPYAVFDGREGEALWRGARALDRATLGPMTAGLARAMGYLRREHDAEGRKWTAELAGYGDWLVAESARSPDWPKGFAITAQSHEDWAAILSGHGQQFFETLVAPFKEKARAGALSLRVFAAPLPGPVRVRKDGGNFSLEIPVPRPGLDRARYLRESREAVEAALR